MKKLCVRLALLPLMVSAACVGSEKSANPLSPVVAGPIAGVGITAPTIVAPTTDALLDTNTQPVMLQVGNAETNGVRPLSYRFEIASDANFTSLVFTRDGVPHDASGRTSLRLPGALSPERKYYWHARAEDGANTGPFGATSAFHIFTPIVFSAPVLLSPINNATASSQPRLVIGNASHTGPVQRVIYLYELSTSAGFNPLIGPFTSAEGANQSELTIPLSLAPGQYFWRAQATDLSHSGPFSPAQSFRIAASGGGGGGGGGGSCGNGDIGGALTAVRAQSIVFATACKYPGLLTESESDAELLLRRTIWHLQKAGFQSGRQRNPSGLISQDKLTIFIDGAWHVYDVYSLGTPGKPTTVQFFEVPLPNYVADPGIPD